MNSYPHSLHSTRCAVCKPVLVLVSPITNQGEDFKGRKRCIGAGEPS